LERKFKGVLNDRIEGKFVGGDANAEVYGIFSGIAGLIAGCGKSKCSGRINSSQTMMAAYSSTLRNSRILPGQEYITPGFASDAECHDVALAE
jgi:hypothetical protein